MEACRVAQLVEVLQLSHVSDLVLQKGIVQHWIFEDAIEDQAADEVEIDIDRLV